MGVIERVCPADLPEKALQSAHERPGPSEAATDRPRRAVERGPGCRAADRSGRAAETPAGPLAGEGGLGVPRAARRRARAPRRRRRRRTGGRRGGCRGRRQGRRGARRPIRAPLRLNIAEPQSPQKNFSAPSAGFQERRRSSPRTHREARGGDPGVGGGAGAGAPLAAGAVAVGRGDERLGHRELDRPAVAGAGERADPVDPAAHEAAPAVWTRSRSGAIRQRPATSARRASSVQRSACSSPSNVGMAALQQHRAGVVAQTPDQRHVLVAQPHLQRQRGELGPLVLDRARVGPDLLDQRGHGAGDRAVRQVPLAGELDHRQAGALGDRAHRLHARQAGLDPAVRAEAAVVAAGELGARDAGRRRTARRSRRRG